MICQILWLIPKSKGIYHPLDWLPQKVFHFAQDVSSTIGMLCMENHMAKLNILNRDEKYYFSTYLLEGSIK